MDVFVKGTIHALFVDLACTYQHSKFLILIKSLVFSKNVSFNYILLLYLLSIFFFLFSFYF